MMLPSPVTTTPFSVKDILNLEQQSRQQATHHLRQELPAQFHSPSSCMHAAGDITSFSDGEEKISFLSTLSVRDSQGEVSLSPEVYVHGTLRSPCENNLEDVILSGEVKSKYLNFFLGGGGGGGGVSLGASTLNCTIILQVSVMFWYHVVKRFKMYT